MPFRPSLWFYRQQRRENRQFGPSSPTILNPPPKSFLPSPLIGADSPAAAMESGHSLPAEVNAEPDNGTSKSGMLVQQREDKVNLGPTIKLRVSYGSSHYEIYVPAHSTFGNFISLSSSNIFYRCV